MGVNEGKHKGNRYFYVRILWELSQFSLTENIFISLSLLKEICQSFGFISVLTVAPMNAIYPFSLTVLNILISLCLHKFGHDAPSFCFVFFWGGVFMCISSWEFIVLFEYVAWNLESFWKALGHYEHCFYLIFSLLSFRIPVIHMLDLLTMLCVLCSALYFPNYFLCLF